MNKYFILLSFVFVLLNCSNSKTTKDLQDEVFNDIFEKLIMSSTQDYRKVTFPNPDQIKLWKKGNDISKKEIDDKRKMLIVINDSIGLPKPPSDKDFNVVNSYKFKFNDFHFNNDNIKLISMTEYKKKPEKINNNFYFGGFLNLSSIKFEISLKKAHLIVNYNCGSLCGQKSKIFIEKINNKWVIIKTELINVS